MPLDPVSLALLVKATVEVAPLLASSANNAFDTAVKLHGQHVRLSELKLENERIIQLEAWQQKRAAQREEWQERRAAQIEAWQEKRSFTEFALDRAREMQRESWQQERKLAREAHRRAIELIEENERSQERLLEFAETLKNWPLTLLPSQVVQFAKSFEGKSPLTVLIAPPRGKTLHVDWDAVQIEQKLSKGLSDFLGRFFPFRPESPRPVHVLANCWKENGLRQQAAIAALFHRLSGQPTLVLSAEVDNNDLQLSAAQWHNENVPTYLPSATISLGARTPEAIFGDLLLCYQLITAAAADLHFLGTAELPPQLPKALSGLFDRPQCAGLSAVFGELASQYRHAYEMLIVKRPAWRPELELELAESLSALPDKSFAREQVDASMRAWLALRGSAPNEDDDVYPLLLGHRKPKRDQSYFERLEQVRRALVAI